MPEYSLKRLKAEAVKDTYSYEVKIRIGMLPSPVSISMDELTTRHARIISRLIDTGEVELRATKAALLFHYLTMCQSCDWGTGKGKDNPFGIHTPDDAWRKTKIKRFHIERPERFKRDWAILETLPEWDSEHGAFVAFLGGSVHGLATDRDFPVIPSP